MKNKIISYAVAFALGWAIALATAFYCDYNYGLFHTDDVQKVFSLLSDVFFVPAVLEIGSGLLVVVSDDGFFDLFGYAFSNFTYLFSRNKEEMERMTYYDYHMMKKAKREGRSIWFLVFVGIFFLVLAALFTVLYYTC